MKFTSRLNKRFKLLEDIPGLPKSKDPLWHPPAQKEFDHAMDSHEIRGKSPKIKEQPEEPPEEPQLDDQAWGSNEDIESVLEKLPEPDINKDGPESDSGHKEELESIEGMGEDMPESELDLSDIEEEPDMMDGQIMEEPMEPTWSNLTNNKSIIFVKRSDGIYLRAREMKTVPGRWIVQLFMYQKNNDGEKVPKMLDHGWAWIQDVEDPTTYLQSIADKMLGSKSYAEEM